MSCSGCGGDNKAKFKEAGTGYKFCGKSCQRTFHLEMVGMMKSGQDEKLSGKRSFFENIAIAYSNEKQANPNIEESILHWKFLSGISIEDLKQNTHMTFDQFDMYIHRKEDETKYFWNRPFRETANFLSIFSKHFFPNPPTKNELDALPDRDIGKKAQAFIDALAGQIVKETIQAGVEYSKTYLLDSIIKPFIEIRELISTPKNQSLREIATFLSDLSNRFFPKPLTEDDLDALPEGSVEKKAQVFIDILGGQVVKEIAETEFERLKDEYPNTRLLDSVIEPLVEIRELMSMKQLATLIPREQLDNLLRLSYAHDIEQIQKEQLQKLNFLTKRMWEK